MDALRNSTRLLISTAAVIVSLSAGCASGGGSGEVSDPYQPAESQYSGAGRSYGNPEPPYAQQRYADVDASRTSQRAAEPQQIKRGDQNPDEPLVPKTARLATEGRGDLSYKASRDGFVYVIDNRDHKMVFEGPIDKDETITIAPYRNVIEINGKRVKRVKDLDNKHIHRIFFERESDRGRDKRDRERERRDR